jgi:hypothetical protein
MLKSITMRRLIVLGCFFTAQAQAQEPLSEQAAPAPVTQPALVPSLAPPQAVPKPANDSTGTGQDAPTAVAAEVTTPPPAITDQAVPAVAVQNSAPHQEETRHWRMSDAHLIVGAERLANIGGYYYDGMTNGEKVAKVSGSEVNFLYSDLGFPRLSIDFAWLGTIGVTFGYSGRAWGRPARCGAVFVHMATRRVSVPARLA